MAPDHVRESEFDRWMQHLDARFDRLEEHHLVIDRRVGALELNQVAAGKLSAKLSAGISATVAGIIAGVAALVGVK